MESLYLLIPLGLLISIFAGAIFWWCATHGQQFDDIDQAAQEIIFDDDLPKKNDQK
jgi:cbb3-type cytochrome oxidase maturation protein